MRFLLAALASLILVGPLSGQVTCSPEVEQKLCSDAERSLNPILDHGVMRGAAIPAEIVTEVQYEKRLADVREIDGRRGGDGQFAGTMFSRSRILDNPFLTAITFFRQDTNAGDSSVSSVLISVAAFDDDEFVFVQGDDGVENMVSKYDGQYSPILIDQAGMFIAGYVEGTFGAVMADSARADSPPQRFREVTKGVSYDNETRQPCLSGSVQVKATDAFTGKPVKLPSCESVEALPSR